MLVGMNPMNEIRLVPFVACVSDASRSPTTNSSSLLPDHLRVSQSVRQVMDESMNRIGTLAS